MSSGKKDPSDPSVTSAAYDAMAPRWAKMNALLGGTEAMRAAGEEFLPRHQEESDDAYAERLACAVLFNQTARTLESMVGRPFSDPVRVDGVTEQVAEWLSDIDLQGNDVGVFARGWFRSGLAKAFAHVLVEMPRPTPRVDGGPLTLEDERAQNLRPYWVAVEPENLIAARVELVGGVEQVVHARIRETVMLPDGFAERSVDRIRVLEPGRVEIWEYRQAERSRRWAWVKVEEFQTGLGRVPLVTFYASREGAMLGQPPLIDLADLNIAHWQSQSDQRAVLTVARFPILAGAGVPDDAPLKVGPFLSLTTSDPQGKFYYVEHTGAAIESGRLDLRDLEDRMADFGAQFLRKQPGNVTATARALDSAEATSPLQDAAVRFEDALNQALALTHEWMKLEPGDARLSISTDFGPEDPDGSGMDAVTKARELGDISRAAYLEELKRRGALADDFDPEEDAERREEESAEMPTGEPTVPTDEDEETPPEDDEEEDGDDAPAE